MKWASILRSCVLYIPLVVCGHAHAQQRVFDVEADEALRALPEFARQAGVQILAPGKILRGVRLPQLKGTFDVRAALRTLIASTSLHIISDNGRVIVLKPIRASAEDHAGQNQDGDTVFGGEPGARELRIASPPLAEIVVTANRREEALSTVPLSIAAFSVEDMDSKTIRSIDDIARSTPGVTFNRGFGNTNNISIRGVTSMGAGTTGVYINDTPIQGRTLNVGAYNIYPLLFDLQRVEVLRGPQGTLFGSGSVGGSVRFITPTPSLTDSSLYARAETASIEHGTFSYETGLAVETPLVADRVGLRLSGWVQSTGGYIDKVDPITREITDKNINSTRARAFKADAKLAASENLTISPSFYYQRQRLNDISQYWEEYSRPNAGDFRSGLVTPQISSDGFKLTSLKLEYAAEGFDLFSNSSYFHRFETSTYDYSTLVPAYFVLKHFDSRFPRYPAYAHFINQQKVLSQEVRAQSQDSDTRLKWIVGAFFSRTKQTAYEDIVDPQFENLIQAAYGQTVIERFGTPMLSRDRIFNQSDDARDRQYAGFGEFSYEIVEGLEATIGGRYADMSVALNNLTMGPFNGGRTTSVDGKSGNAGFNPKIGLSWQRDLDSLYYATISKGFRPGGLNQKIPYVAGICQSDQDRFGGPAPQTYNSDNIWSYEAGFKNYFMERRLYVSVGTYYMDWNNIQLNRTACGLNYIENAGTAASKGFDVAATIRPTSSLSLGLGLSYVNANYTKTLQGLPNPSTGLRPTTIMAGDGLAVQPWSLTANARYEFGLWSHEAYVRGDYEFRGGLNRTAQLDPRTSIYNPDALIPEHTHFLSMRAGFIVDSWEASVFVKNLTDTSVQLSRFFDRSTVKGLNKGKTFQPRTVGLTITAKY